MLLATKILLTIVTLGYSAVPSYFDLNASHATNPSWTGHARYHVIWQVSTFDYLALLSLVLIWTAGGASGQLWVPVIVAIAAFGGFWTALLTQGLYGGILQDQVNGVPKFHFNLVGVKFAVDVNVSLFAPLTVLTLIALWMVMRLSAGT